MPGTPRATPAGPSLFDPPDVRELSADASAPLAVRMRPRDLSELVGQSELVAPGSPLRRLIEGSGASSVILWGPPGTGKTTIAALVSRAGGRRFVELSAVTAGVKEVRAAIDSARMSGVPTVLFIDEVHRFTRTQQDALLPGVENGWVTLVAATTENPSFSVVAPLLSRSLLLALRSLAEDEVGLLLDRAVSDPRGLAGRVRLAPDARADLVRYAGGDARRALTYLEAAADAVDRPGPAAEAVDRRGPAADAVDRRGPAADAVDRPGSAADPLHRGASADLSGGADAPPRSRSGGGRGADAVNRPGPAADPVEGPGPAADPVEGPGPAADPLHRGASADLSGGADAPPRSRSGGGRGADAVNRPGPAADPVEGPGPTAEAVDRPDGHGPDGDGSGSAHPAGVPVVTAEHVAAAVQRALVRYDRTGDQHYDVISAFIKSVRGSDVDAALHYLARMIEAGEDPRFIARRLVILASEDVGMADPTALGVATAAMTAAAQIGLPEARLPLAQATIHLSCAPKSNAVIRAIDAAQADVRAGRIGPVPPHLRDGHHPGAAAQGVVGYRYPHEDPSGVLAQQYAPDPVRGRRYYAPTGHGVEARLGDLVERLRAAVDGTRVDPARGSRDEPTP